MARARNIKPGFFLNEDLAELHPLTRLMFIGLWTISDFKGCIEWRPKRVKLQTLPYDDHDIETAADNLAKAGFLARYKVDGKRYVKIINFVQHQNPHKQEREAGSSIPDFVPPQTIENKEVDVLPNNFGSTSEVNVPLTDSLNPITDSVLREGAAVAAEPEPECKPADIRKNHPAIVAIREVTNRYPPKEIWDELIDQVGFDADVVRLRKCYAAWIGYGYNRTNFNWVYDWYVNNRIPKTGEKNGTHRNNQNGKRDTSADRIAATADIYDKYPSEADLIG